MHARIDDNANACQRQSSKFVVVNQPVLWYFSTLEDIPHTQIFKKTTEKMGKLKKNLIPKVTSVQ